MIYNKTYIGVLAFSPVVIGYVLNLSIMLPLFSLLQFVIPFILLAYWFWVGGKFAEVVKNSFAAVLAGNFFGIVSFLIYYWQFIFLTGENRSLWLAVISQMFNAPLSFITVRAGSIFESAPNTFSQTSVTASQAVGLLLMVLTFSTGYFHTKNKRKVTR
ncbi:MAG: hypothetical protein SCK29_03815 [Bacillota bacterium]|nr:hypothetical protein [Bacillota bacterium]MDW7683233.1 hypothetical protein [Bacillota bacterium]